MILASSCHKELHLIFVYNLLYWLPHSQQGWVAQAGQVPRVGFEPKPSDSITKP